MLAIDGGSAPEMAGGMNWVPSATMKEVAPTARFRSSHVTRASIWIPLTAMIPNRMVDAADRTGPEIPARNRLTGGRNASATAMPPAVSVTNRLPMPETRTIPAFSG
ncbi:hypothetical protein BFL35_09420 [Clavibacter michiganensis]|nr:hypothetical protein BFL35_09420 [Clavibacter michiganensis]